MSPYYTNAWDQTWGQSTQSTTATTVQWATSNVTTTNLTSAPLTTAKMAKLSRTFAKRKQRYATFQDMVPKPKWGDRLKTALNRVAGGPVKDVKEPPALRTPGGMEILPIGGAAPNAEVTRHDEDLPSVPGRKKIVLTRTVPVKRHKNGRTQEVHSGKVTLVRTTDGPDHLTENISVKAEPDVTGSHVEIPIKDLEKAIKDLKRA